MLILGDIAGQYKTLLALLKQCPNEEPISVGDMVDRGPDSKSVLDFFMSNGRAILGNHEAMMLDSFLSGDFSNWLKRGNGGTETLLSFDIHDYPTEEQADLIDPYLDWLDNLPLFIREPGLIITHAPIPEHIEPSNKLCGEYLDDFIWNRSPPIERTGEFQVFGHNGRWGLTYFQDFAVCLDTSAQNILTAMEWPSRKIYQQPYIG